MAKSSAAQIGQFRDAGGRLDFPEGKNYFADVMDNGIQHK